MSNQISVVENTFVQQKEAIIRLIPEESFDKFRTFLASAALDNPELNQATASSITRAFLDCAKVGLMPDGDEAAIVTRKDNKTRTIIATFQPMVKGVVRVINNSPQIKSFHVKAVYEGDDFKLWSDESGDHLSLVPSFEVDRSDKNIKLFYASAVLDNGTVIIEVMTKAQVDKHKACAKQQYVWNAWYSEMGIKTIIHRILKRLPVSNPEIVKGLESSLDLALNKPASIQISQEPEIDYTDLLDEIEGNIARINTISELNDYFGIIDVNLRGKAKYLFSNRKGELNAS